MIPTHKIQLRHPALGWRDYVILALPRTTGNAALTPDKEREFLATCIPAGWPPARVVPFDTPPDWSLEDRR